MCTCGDLPDRSWELWRTARKQHECCECGSTIDQGERYRVCCGVWSGEFDYYKHCEICAEAWDKATSRLDDGCGLVFGQLWEYIGTNEI